MPKFGNSSASALVRSAEAGLKSQQNYNDAIAEYNYNASAHTQDDYNQLQSYLKDRLTKVQTQGDDPMKALNLQKSLDSAFHTYTSAEILRQSIGLNYGDTNWQDKYNRISQLRDQAMQNGDMSLAQQLEGQMASTYKSGANGGSGGYGGGRGTSAATAQNNGYKAAVKTLTDLQKTLEDAHNNGQISDATYALNLRKIVMGDPDAKDPNAPAAQGLRNLYAQAAQDGNLTESEQGTWSDKYDSLTADDKTNKIVNGDQAFRAMAGDTNENAIERTKDGFTYVDRLTKTGDAGVVLDNNGQPLKDRAKNSISMSTYENTAKLAQGKNGAPATISDAEVNYKPAGNQGQFAVRHLGQYDFHTDNNGFTYVLASDLPGIEGLPGTNDPNAKVYFWTTKGKDGNDIPHYSYNINDVKNAKADGANTGVNPSLGDKVNADLNAVIGKNNTVALKSALAGEAHTVKTNAANFVQEASNIGHAGIDGLERFRNLGNFPGNLNDVANLAGKAANLYAAAKQAEAQRMAQLQQQAAQAASQAQHNFTGNINTINHNYIQPAENFVGHVGQEIGQAANGVGNFINNDIVQPVEHAAGNVWNGITGAARGVGNAIGGAINTVGSWFK